MDNIINLPHTESYSHKAKEKIAEELKTFKGDRYAMAVKNHVASTLTHFCGQDERFAEVVYKTKRTLSDCCAQIMQGCGQSISDIDVYRGAVRHYFPNADIDFHMSITLKGEAPTEEEMSRVPKEKPAPAPAKKAEGKKSTKTEKPAQAAPVAPVTPAAPKPKAEKGAQTPEFRRPTPPPDPKPAAQPKKAKTKDNGPKFEDTNVIQLSLF